jgi:predicted ATPase
VGVEPRSVDRIPSAADSYFLIERQGRVYDLAEMSSGEQAVFPLLYEFVRQDIAHSVVLIDELELHLHPPQQQALLNALRRIGPDCQFIITSHSPYLETVVPDEDEVRLPGGQRCL